MNTTEDFIGVSFQLSKKVFVNQYTDYWQHVIVMGWQNRLKFIGKTNRLKISFQNAYFYYFGQFYVFL